MLFARRPDRPGGCCAGRRRMLTRHPPLVPRVTGWMLALIFYKPAAAAVYATGSP